MMNARQLSKMATAQQLSANTIAESKPDSEVMVARYVGYSNGYQFRTPNGGTVTVAVVSTQEPQIGESLILQREAGSDRVIAKPKPRL